MLGRRVQNIFPDKERVIELLSSKKLTFYCGVDPTGPSIHIGHTVQLIFLKQLAELGHKVIILIGDFTAKIGDPTGKDTTRRPLTGKEVKENMKDYLRQIDKVLPKKLFQVKYNSKWLGKMSFEDVVRLASHVTVQQMIVRDMFQERIKSEKPIGVHEFLYPLMQGYDSVAMGVDGEVGGNDQTFNMLIGRDLVKEYLGKEKIVLATKLLVDADTGKKMSKSEGPLISIADSPKDVFGKTMAMPDSMVKVVFELCTEKDQAWIDKAYEETKTNPKPFKEDLATELVRMYYGDKEAQEAKKEWERVFSSGELPVEMPEYGEGEIIEVLAGSGLVGSKSEAKRLLSQNAVQVNSETINDWSHNVKKGDIVKVGPRKFLKII